MVGERRGQDPVTPRLAYPLKPDHLCGVIHNPGIRAMVAHFRSWYSSLSFESSNYAWTNASKSALS